MPDLLTAENGVLVCEGNQKIFLEYCKSKKHRALYIIGLILGTLIVLGGLGHLYYIYTKSGARNCFDTVQGGPRSIRNIATATDVNTVIHGLFSSEFSNPDVNRMKVICTTKICNETALDMQNSMNLSVNPCENFYDFACSRYKPKINGAVSPFDELLRKYYRITREMTDTLKGPPRLNEHPIIRHARNVYNNCMITGTQSVSAFEYSSYSTHHVRHFIRKTLNISEWPSQKLAGLGTNYLNKKITEFRLQFSLAPVFSMDLFLPSLEDKFTFGVKNPTFLLPMGIRSSKNQGSFDYQDLFNRYSMYVSELMSEFGGQSQSYTYYHGGIDAELKERSDEVIRFEQALFDITGQQSYIFQTTYEELTLTELDRLTINNNSEKSDNQTTFSLSLRQTLEYILQKTGNPSLQGHDKIGIFNSTLLKNMASLISSTKKEIVVNYLGYRLAHYLYPLSLDVERKFTFTAPFIPSRIDNGACMDFAMEIFMPALTRYPEQMTEEQRSMFGGNVERNLREIYSNIKAELLRKLPNNNQLTRNRTISAWKDIQNVRFCQDNWLFNRTGIEEYYSGIYPLKNSYLEQYSTLRSWDAAKEFWNIGKTLSEIDTCDIHMRFPNYNQVSRQINIPPFVWMEPFYKYQWPRYLKYSGIGFIVGHEGMHALFNLVPEWVDHPKVDNNLTQNINLSLKDGLLKVQNSVYPTLQLYNILNKKTFRSSQCIVDHYDGFSNRSVAKWDGIRTFQENFADIGGMRLAYSVYKSGLFGEVEETLPGFEDYSNDQIFFLNYARGWCDTRPMIYWGQTNPHSPSKYRVLGTLRNSEEFSRAWNCPVGSYMNPGVDKCSAF